MAQFSLQKQLDDKYASQLDNTADSLSLVEDHIFVQLCLPSPAVGEDIVKENIIWYVLCPMHMVTCA